MEPLGEFMEQEIDTKDKWHRVRGTWAWRDGAHVFDGHQDEENAEGLLLCDIPLANGEISADIGVMDDPAKTLDPCAHIVFHFLSSDDFYVAGIGGWDGLYSIGRKLPSETLSATPRWERLTGDGQRSQIAKYRWYPITISFVGGKVEFRFSNIPIFQLTAGYGREAGHFGLRGYGDCRARFRINRVARKIRRSDVGARLASADLSFLHFDVLRDVAERDLAEARGLDADASSKATVILLGSIAEALLLDALWYRETQESGSTKVTESNLNKWNLSKLIDKANGFKLLDRSTYATSHILRGYRNLVHPGNEDAQTLGPRPAQAVAAIDFLLALIRDLSAKA
ncbi:MAG: hypothetical protein IMY80_05320 [Chloroflexi bacterium]|nr:hypothetical protein [Chloroflexota bacterium]